MASLLNQLFNPNAPRDTQHIQDDVVSSYHEPSLFGDASPIHIDPDNPGTVYTYAAIIESIFKIIGGTAMLAYPTWCLSLMSYAGTSAVTTPAVTITLVQWLGASTLGLTPQLLLSIPNTRTAIESRQMVYICLLAGESFLLLVMMAQAVLKAEKTGLTPEAMTVAWGTLAITTMWRLIMLGQPQWFGRYSEMTMDYSKKEK